MLTAPVQAHRHMQMTPSARPLLSFKGNSAHSSGFWFARGGTIYFGGSLFEDAQGRLRYNAGRQLPARDTCAGDVGQDSQDYSCRHWMGEEGYTVIEQTKVFLSRGVGLSHWGRRMEVIGFEAHDVGLGLAILADKGYLTEALVQCRSACIAGRPSSLRSLADGRRGQLF